MVTPCFKPRINGDKESGSRGRIDKLLWYKDLGSHMYGEYSMSVVQANHELEDQSQFESGPLSFSQLGPSGLFIGVYDGHGGTEASQFVSKNLLYNLKRYATDHHGISETVIEKAFSATDNDFLSLVKKQWLDKPEIATVGSCCLVGIICDGTMFIANAGDSRVLLGTARNSSEDVVAIQLSTEHNVSQETVREELRSSHPYDSDIVVRKRKAWRIKGIIQVSRSMGDAYLKRANFNEEPTPFRFRLPGPPFLKPILSSEPSISVHKIRPEDQFLVFASDGLWEILSNQAVVNMVHKYPRDGIAKRLVKAAIREAAKKRNVKYTDLKKMKPGKRRNFHDDITVIVVYLNMRPNSNNSHSSTLISMKGGSLLLPD